MSARPITLVLGTAAGAILAAGLTSLATSPVAHATCVEDVFFMQICGFDDTVTTLGDGSSCSVSAAGLGEPARVSGFFAV